MATNYPGGIDAFTNPTSGDPLTSPAHSGQHANANDAIEAIEAELGTLPKGSAASVKARLDAIETGARLGLTTKGDIAARDASTVTRLPVGADGQVLVADSAAATGLAWAGPIGNLLTANQALGDDWGYNYNFCTDSAAGGTLTLTSGASGGMSVSTTAIPVSPGETLTVSGEITSVGSGLSDALVGVSLRNAGGSELTKRDGTPYAAGQSGRSLGTIVAPAGTVNAYVYVYAGTTAAAQSLQVRQLGLWRGAGGEWAMPGVPITNLGIRPNPADTSQVQVWNSATQTWITV